MQQLSLGAQKHFKEYFTWERKGKVISQAYLDILYPNSERKITNPKEETELLAVV